MGSEWTMKNSLPGGDFLIHEKKELVLKLQKKLVWGPRSSIIFIYHVCFQCVVRLNILSVYCWPLRVRWISSLWLLEPD